MTKCTVLKINNLLLSLLFCFSAFSGQTFHFVSIEKLVEQEVGRKLLAQIYHKARIKIKITALPGKRAQQELRIGRVDGEVLRIENYLNETPESLRVPTPIYKLVTTAFIRKDSDIEIKSLADLKKYSVVRVSGVKHTNLATKNVQKVWDSNSTEEMFNFIKNRRADVALTNRVDGEIILQALGLNSIVALDNDLAIYPLYHYVHKSHKNLVPKIDRIIQELKTTGELDKMIKRAEESVINKYLRTYKKP